MITSRRVGGSSILLLVGAARWRDVAMRFVQPSRLPPFRRRRRCHRDADHCYSRLHRKLDYGVLRDRPHSRARRRRHRLRRRRCRRRRCSTLFGGGRERLPLLLSVAHPLVFISPPIRARLRHTRTAASTACIQMHRATTRLRNATIATSKISPPERRSLLSDILSRWNLAIGDFKLDNI